MNISYVFRKKNSIQILCIKLKTMNFYKNMVLPVLLLVLLDFHNHDFPRLWLS